MLVGAASDPDPNDKSSYSWVQIGGPALTLNDHDTHLHLQLLQIYPLIPN
jgi:hypothetical protein